MDGQLNLSKYLIKRVGGFNYNFECDDADGKKVIDAKAKGLGYSHFLLCDLSGKTLGEVKTDSNWTLNIGPVPVAGTANKQLTNFADMADADQKPLCLIKHDRSTWPIPKYVIMKPDGTVLALANAQGPLSNDVDIVGPNGTTAIAHLYVPKVDGILNKLKEGSSGLMELDISDDNFSRMILLGFSVIVAGSKLQGGSHSHAIK